MAIFKELEAITDDILEKLINSMPKRIGEIFSRHGRHIDD